MEKMRGNPHADRMPERDVIPGEPGVPRNGKDDAVPVGRGKRVKNEITTKKTKENAMGNGPGLVFRLRLVGRRLRNCRTCHRKFECTSYPAATLKRTETATKLCSGKNAPNRSRQIPTRTPLGNRARTKSVCAPTLDLTDIRKRLMVTQCWDEPLVSSRRGPAAFLLISRQPPRHLFSESRDVRLVEHRQMVSRDLDDLQAPRC